MKLSKLIINENERTDILRQHGLIVENKLGKPIKSDVLEIPKIGSDVRQNNTTLLSRIQQSGFGEKVNLTDLNPNQKDFLVDLSNRLLNAGIEPFLYTYVDEEKPEQAKVSGGLTYYIPNTDISVLYEPGVFGVGFGNLSLSYEPDSKKTTAGLIIPINK